MRRMVTLSIRGSSEHSTHSPLLNSSTGPWAIQLGVSVPGVAVVGDPYRRTPKDKFGSRALFYETRPEGSSGIRPVRQQRGTIAAHRGSLPKKARRVRGMLLHPSASGLTARIWLTPIRLASKASAEAAM